MYTQYQCWILHGSNPKNNNVKNVKKYLLSYYSSREVPGNRNMYRCWIKHNTMKILDVGSYLFFIRKCQEHFCKLFADIVQY